MNCQETRELIEDALDKRLTGGVKRKFDLHLTHCQNCRRFYEAEQAEHARWFRAMNDIAADPPHKLPPDFADRLVAAVVAKRAAHTPFFSRFRIPRWAKIAASLLALASFVTFAAVVIVEKAAEDEDSAALEGTEATEWTEATVAIFSEDFPAVSSVPGVSSVASIPSAPTTDYQLETNQGETIMKKGRAAAAALSAAMAAAPLAAANGDEYQFIISGEVVAATTGCSSDSSATAALVGGPLADGAVYDSELEARYRTMDESNTCSLRSDRAGFIISFR